MMILSTVTMVNTMVSLLHSSLAKQPVVAGDDHMLPDYTRTEYACTVLLRASAEQFRQKWALFSFYEMFLYSLFLIAHSFRAVICSQAVCSPLSGKRGLGILHIKHFFVFSIFLPPGAFDRVAS